MNEKSEFAQAEQRVLESNTFALLRLQDWVDKHTRSNFAMAQIWGIEIPDVGTYCVSVGGEGVKGATLADAINNALDDFERDEVAQAAADAAKAAHDAALQAEQERLAAAAQRSADAFWQEYEQRTADVDGHAYMLRHDMLMQLAQEWSLK
jgi:hypothetical protein